MTAMKRHRSVRSERLRRFTARSAAIHAGILGVLLFLGWFAIVRESRLPKGAVGGEGKTVALGEVPVKRVEPEEIADTEQERKVEHRPRIITRYDFAPHVLAVPVPDQLPDELSFDDITQDFLSPSLLEAAGVLGAAAGESRAGIPNGFDSYTRLYPYQVYYRGGDWNPDPSALSVLMRELNRRTRLPVSDRVQVVRLARLDPKAENPPPFLFITGHGNILLSDTEIDNLREYLLRGGLLIADDCGPIGFNFDGPVRALFKRLFPKIPVRRIPMNHGIYRSYYPLKQVQGGLTRFKTYHEGVFLSGRLTIFYSRNDLACAWERRPDGKPVHVPCHPGGEDQREWAYQMGVNLIVYAIAGK